MEQEGSFLCSQEPVTSEALLNIS